MTNERVKEMLDDVQMEREREQGDCVAKILMIIVGLVIFGGVLWLIG